MAMLEAPAPIMATLTSSIFLPTTLRALIDAGQHDRGRALLVVVPDRDVGSSARSVSRMRKHLGWEMSSRLMPPKDGCSLTARSR